MRLKTFSLLLTGNVRTNKSAHEDGSCYRETRAPSSGQMLIERFTLFVTKAKKDGIKFKKKNVLNLFVCLFVPEQGHTDADTFFYMLIVFSIISSLYTLIWDLRMDWGLFDRGAGENTFLREEIVYPHKVRIQPTV